MDLNPFQIANKLTEARFYFAIECLNKIKQLKPREDCLFSPYAIYETLLLLYFGSSGAIEELLKRILHLSDIPKCNLIEYYSLKKDYQVQSEFQNNMAFRACSNYYDNTDIRLVINCWITNTKPLNVTTLQNIFKDRFEAVDFRNCSASLLTRINNMSLDAGDNYMHNPSALCLISELMEIFLSTVFSLKIKEFQISEPYRSLPSNRQSGHLKWMCKNYVSYDLGLHICELPYKNENLSMFVLLPEYCTRVHKEGHSFKKINIVNDLTKLLKRISAEGEIRKLHHILDNNVTTEDSFNFVIWPSFEMEKELPIYELLQALGAGELLTNGEINMGDFFAGNEDRNLHLGGAVHRVNIKVTQQETRAGAVTSIYTGKRDFRPSNQIVCESSKPYVWLIYDKLHRNVLFAGTHNSISERDSNLIVGTWYSSYGFF